MKLWLALTLLLACLLPAAAADWTIERLRGSVVQQVNGNWLPVARGDVIPSNRVLRTGADGRAALRRNAETIELSANTQIRLGDAGDALMTTVFQDFGVVAVEAERRNVQHFSVQTPYLAAVVKGTRFVVRADANGASVDVQRGVVQVQDKENSLVTDIRPGQEASVGSDAPLNVTGSGTVAVFRFDGQPVVPGTTTDLVSSAEPGAAASIQATGNAASSDRKDLAGDNGNGRSETSNAGGNRGVRADVGGVSVSVGTAGNGNSNGSNAGGNSNGNGRSEFSNAGGNSDVRADVGGGAVSVNTSGNGNAGGNSNVRVDAVGTSVSVSSDSPGNGNANNVALPHSDVSVSVPGVSVSTSPSGGVGVNIGGIGIGIGSENRK